MGVLQTAVLSLIQDVEASTLVVCAVGRTGNLRYRGYKMSSNYKNQSVNLFMQEWCESLLTVQTESFLIRNRNEVTGSK